MENTVSSSTIDQSLELVLFFLQINSQADYYLFDLNLIAQEKTGTIKKKKRYPQLHGIRLTCDSKTKNYNTITVKKEALSPNIKCSNKTFLSFIDSPHSIFHSFRQNTDLTIRVRSVPSNLSDYFLYFVRTSSPVRGIEKFAPITII